jgi:hypothetical protein
MLDVHPPHAPTHTWRDFLIHIATICVGLLIAIALEQSVEALHHHHQREELIADFRGECQRNIDIVDRDIAALRRDRDWERSWLATLLKSSQDPGLVSLTLPSRTPSMQLQGPSGAVWTIAKSNTKAALLPENLSEIYDRVEHENDQAYRKSDVATDALVQLTDMARADGFTFDPLQASGPLPVTLSFTQRTALIATLSHLIGATNNCIRWMSILKGASEAVLHNVSSRDAMMPYIQKMLPQSDFQ